MFRRDFAKRACPLREAGLPSTALSNAGDELLHSLGGHWDRADSVPVSCGGSQFPPSVPSDPQRKPRGAGPQDDAVNAGPPYSAPRGQPAIHDERHPDRAQMSLSTGYESQSHQRAVSFTCAPASARESPPPEECLSSPDLHRPRSARNSGKFGVFFTGTYSPQILDIPLVIPAIPKTLLL